MPGLSLTAVSWAASTATAVATHGPQGHDCRETVVSMPDCTRHSHPKTGGNGPWLESVRARGACSGRFMIASIVLPLYMERWGVVLRLGLNVSAGPDSVAFVRACTNGPCHAPQNRSHASSLAISPYPRMMHSKTCGQRRVGSKNSQTTPATTSTSSMRQLLGAADTQTAHHATFSTAPTHQRLGSANTETTAARAPAAAADRKQQPDAACEGKNG